MAYEDTPLVPTQRTLRMVLGQDGDTGVEAHAKLDRIKDDTQATLTDTAQMQPIVGSASSYTTGTIGGDLVLLNTLLNNANVDTDAILALLNDGGFGLQAIQNAITAARAVIDDTNTKIGTPTDTDIATDIANVQTVADSSETKIDGIITTLGTPATTSLGADNAEIISKIDQMQNNTRTTVAMLTEMEVPHTGTDYFLIQLNNFDDVGNMLALNSLPTVTVKTFNGVDRTNNLVDDSNNPSSTMILDSLGRYHIRYAVAYDAVVNEGLLFTFTLKEGNPEVTRTIDRLSRVVEEVSSTFTANDRITLGEVLADTDSLQSTQVPAIDTRLTNTQTTVNADYALDQVIDGKADTIIADLDVVKNKDTSATFDQSTDSLEALSERLDGLASDIAGITAVSSVTQSFLAKKISGSLAQGASELVNLGTAEGVRSPSSKIVELKVIPTTTTSTNFTVEVFEDSAATKLFARYKKAKANKGDLAIRVNLNYYNQDSTPSNNIYVKITNVADSSTSTFNVEVRGDIIELV